MPPHMLTAANVSWLQLLVMLQGGMLVRVRVRVSPKPNPNHDAHKQRRGAPVAFYHPQVESLDSIF